MDAITFASNMGTAFALGMLIGIEREVRHHEAGLRTNALVALGAALFVSLARFVDHEGSPTRVAGQVVSGIGFLAAVIIRDGFSVRGLTTAATLWCTAAIGTLAGSGFPLAATVGASMIVVLHLMLRPLSIWLNLHAKKYAQIESGYRIRVTCDKNQEPGVRAKLLGAIHAEKNLNLLGLQGLPGSQPGEHQVVAEVHAAAQVDEFIERLSSELSQADGVLAAGWDRTAGRPVT